MFTAKGFKIFLGLESLMTIEVPLELDKDVIGGMVNEDTSAIVHFIGLCFSTGREESALCGTNKMIDGDFLTW